MKINEKDQARIRKQAKVMKTQCPEKGNEDGFQRYEKKMPARVKSNAN